MHFPRGLILASLALLTTTTHGQISSATSSTPASVATPVVAQGYSVQRVAYGLTTPRGIIFDSQDNLLVVQSGVGITALTFANVSGRYEQASLSTVVTDSSLNHGIELSSDGRTLYASSTESVSSWGYNASSKTTTSSNTTLVRGMTTSDHTTRTLLLSKKVPGLLVVTRGSTSNIDPLAMDITTGHSQIKAFNLTNLTSTPFDFDTSGLLLGWGMRNDVGIAEEPTLGGLYSVENSVDQMTRNGVDIHPTNPAEELNYMGTLANNSSPNQGSNFGYPQCYTAWDVSVIPENSGLETGMQFAIGTLNSTNNDTFCQKDRTAPRLGFEAHMAPLDIKFNTAGTEAWVTFHGSWDRAPLTPSGYKISAIPFSNGEPVAKSTSNTGYIDVVANANNSNCPGSCFRPVGLAFDSEGRLFFSSDATGEIYMITKESATNGSLASVSPTVNPTSSILQTLSTPTSTTTGTNGGNAERVSTAGLWVLVGVAALMI